MKNISTGTGRVTLASAILTFPVLKRLYSFAHGRSFACATAETTGRPRHLAIFTGVAVSIVCASSTAQTMCLSAPNPTRPDWVATDSNPKWGTDVEADSGTFVMMDAPANGSASRLSIFGPDSMGNIIEKQKISLGARANRIAARGGVIAVAFSVAPQVRLFHKNANGTYSAATLLTAPTGASGFGTSIAIGGDGLSLVVGAPSEGAGPYGSSGAIYVYSRASATSGQWTQSARLVPSGGSTGNEQFGRAVAIDGNRIAAAGFGITWQIRVASFARSGSNWSGETDRVIADRGGRNWIGLIGEWLIMPFDVRPVCFGCGTYSGPAFAQLNLINGQQYSFQVPQGFGSESGFAARDGMLAFHKETSQAGGSRFTIEYYEFDPANGKYYPYSFRASGYSGFSTGYSAAIDNYNYISADPSVAWGALTNYGAASIGTAITVATDCNSNGQVDACDIRNGIAIDINSNGTPDSCESACRLADFDGDGAVSGGDLGQMLGAWGTAATRFDLNGDNTISGADLGILLGAWGSCTN